VGSGTVHILYAQTAGKHACVACVTCECVTCRYFNDYHVRNRNARLKACTIYKLVVWGGGGVTVGMKISKPHTSVLTA
jgi:hypothetical protein